MNRSQSLGIAMFLYVIAALLLDLSGAGEIERIAILIMLSFAFMVMLWEDR